jgi:hypothetical protein
VPPVNDDQVVEAVLPEGSDHSFAERVGLRRSRRRGATPRAEALHPAPEPDATERVAIIDEETQCLVVTVAHGFDEGLGGLLGARRGRQPDAQDLTASEV